MFEVTVEETFAAGHALRNYRGKCEHLHGHNYRLRVSLAGERLNEAGLLVDFTEIKRLLRDIVDPLDHRLLNEVPPFDALNPSAENMARYFYEQLAASLAASRQDVRVAEVKLWETDTSAATYRP